MAQKLGALAGLAKNGSLVPNTHTHLNLFKKSCKTGAVNLRTEKNKQL